MSNNWAERYATRIQSMKGSAIREILKLTELPDVISFAGGLPAPELFPSERVKEASIEILDQHGSHALQYSITEGYPPLREMVCEQMRSKGVPCTIKNVLIMSGSQQALDLIGKILINPGDKILVEEPTYLGALQAWNAYQSGYITVATDDDGLRMDALEEALKTGEGKFLYALPNYQNPTGISLSPERRGELVRLAAKYNTPIVEDNPYGELRFEGEENSLLIALDAKGRTTAEDGTMIDGNVLYLGTFSKTLCPGFRVAWIIGPVDVLQRVVQAKQGADLHTSTYTQMVAYQTARDGFVEAHVEVLRKVYRERRDLMLGLMDELFPPGVTWTHPQGGLFLWVRLPEGMNATELFEKAVENKVAFVPGEAFYPLGGGENTLRMNFSNATPEQIEVGIKRLADVIKAEMQKQ